MKTYMNMALLALLICSCEPTNGRGDTFTDPISRVDPRAKKLELPAFEKDEHVLDYDGFTSSYNHTTLIPNWVAYELTFVELDGSYDTRSSNFSRDPNLEGPQASREDYSHSGWDKGHMAPKADMRWSSSAYWQSHYFTNVCPQNHNFNAGDWNTLEKQVRKWAKKYGKVWVVCGPIFTDREFGTIGHAKVQVPDLFFKALLIKNGSDYSAIAYVMPNRAKHHPLKEYACTIDDLEEMIGRDLFPKLDDHIETKVESEISWLYWQ